MSDVICLFTLVANGAHMFCWGATERFTITVQKSFNSSNALETGNSTPIKYMRCWA